MIRLEKLLTWTNSISYDDGHVINEYIATVSMHTGTEDQNQQTTAYHRMKYWIGEVLANSVILNDQDPLLPAYLNTRQRVIVLPADPVDHLMTMMLYLKLNAIMEDRLIVDEIKLSSDLGDHMCYIHSDEIDGTFFETQGWWVDPRPIWFNRDSTCNDKVVELNREHSWSSLGLSWEPNDKSNSNVVFADFRPNDQK